MQLLVPEKSGPPTRGADVTKQLNSGETVGLGMKHTCVEVCKLASGRHIEPYTTQSGVEVQILNLNAAAAGGNKRDGFSSLSTGVLNTCQARHFLFFVSCTFVYIPVITTTTVITSLP